ncbi:hypothetical protein GIB67_009507 [Kingdonia uniflora]|uniref:F-box domain-containing protein n=1 Tax=Kingdonia uniflora TaxID=39325 RepID=A0A7J7NW27_9MAGN|nr:hypothetical protein GIB67_009500 [Kingdonia uniflora]KAF6171366.1 hypothetical protein GIB67_009507 [Kingdonia uniflora]
MTYREALKAVFPLLDGKDLVSCMRVCKQWEEIARDDYFWKCLCAKRWPSICKRAAPPSLTYHKLYLAFCKRQTPRTLLPPKLSFDDLEFYVDLWAEDDLIFSEVIPGPVFQTGIKILPPGICSVLRFYLEGPDYKMMLPVQPRFTVPLNHTVSVSVLVGQKNTGKIACIVNKSMFDYIDRTSYRALAFSYLDFSPAYPFISGIRAWVSLLFMGDENDGVIDVFGIEMDFNDVANSEEEVLWLLDMLDWK